MSVSEREKKILDYLAREETINVNDLAAYLGVSGVTIRNDLSNLAENGYLLRTRGGAVPAFHPDVLERQRSAVELKTRIARKAAELITDGDRIMIEAGTTTALMVRFLLGKQDIHLVSNSTLLLPYTRINPGLHLSLVGGEFRAQTESLVGPMALEFLSRFHVQYAFVGTDGFSENGLTTHLVEGAEVVKMMASQAGKTVLLADSGKLDKLGFVHVLPFDQIDILISDESLPVRFRDFCKENNIKLLLV